MGHSDFGRLEFVLLLEIFDFVVGVRDDRVLSGLPSRGTHFSVLVNVLESLHQSKGFVNITRKYNKSLKWCLISAHIGTPLLVHIDTSPVVILVLANT